MAKVTELESRVTYLEDKVEFLSMELKKVLERNRTEDLISGKRNRQNITQTKDSFDYKWTEVTDGRHSSSNKEFRDGVNNLICQYLGGNIDKDFFHDKNVADVGCGLGRFTYGLLDMGAKVTAMDQSSNALDYAARLCEPYKENLVLEQTDILNIDLKKYKEKFDLVWSFGVVHHTGNTYLAMDNICNMVKPGGMIFMMVYGFPENAVGFRELIGYERLRHKLRNMNFEEQLHYLKSTLPEEQVQGWFDAVSPQINDLLTFEEIYEFLQYRNFKNIIRTVNSRNIHLIATKSNSN